MAPKRSRTMEETLSNLDDSLVSVFLAIAKGAAYISDYLRMTSDTETSAIGTTNAFGDEQLQADVRADLYLYDVLQQCGAVESACSEEQPEEKEMGGEGFSVAFDPLDGSSIVGADWAVGSIFAIWPGSSIVGQKVGDAVGAAYAVYGPRTLLVLARPTLEGMVAQEFALTATGRWLCTNPRVSLPRGGRGGAAAAQPPKRYFAPANLRCAAANAPYQQLVAAWMSQRYTLRYSGGLVPDVHHMLAKGGGVFCNPASPCSPPKLRLLFEVAALAMVVEAAGGASHDGAGSLLQRTLETVDQRTVVALGTKQEVEKCVPALQASAPPINGGDA